jgi:N-acetylglucosaminyl-diphospho-decaprenol L-rhamnosyltransferase
MGDMTAERAGQGSRIVDVVDVVLPTLDGRATLITCLSRLVAEDSVATIVVVDGGSAGGNLETIAGAFPDVIVERTGGDRGLSHAFNRGVRAGRAEFVLFLNDDLVPAPSATRLLIEALRADEEAVCAGGRLVDPGTLRTQNHYQPRRIPGLTALLVRISGIERAWPRNPWTGEHLRDPLPDSGRIRTDRQLAGACLLVRRAILERERGWDERFWVWYEDVDLLRRLLDHGPAVYVPEAVFEHIGGASTRGWRRHEQHLRRYHGTMVYAQKHLPHAGQVTLGLAMVAVCLPRLIAYSALRDKEAAATYARLMQEAAAVSRLQPIPRFAPLGGGEQE